MGTKAEKLLQIAESEKKVFDAGYAKGKAEGGGGGLYDEGFADGKQAEYDHFWNAFQQNGERVDYSYAFGGLGWTDDLFNPKYNIKPTNANSMFYNSGITNLKGLLAEAGITLDFSESIALTYPFRDSKITRLGVIDTRLVGNLSYILSACRSLISLDKLMLKDDGSQQFSSALSFTECNDLEEIRFEGVIGQPNFNMQWSTKLSKDSLENIIEHLSATTSGISITLSNVAVNKAFETTDGANDGSTSAEWLALIATKSNWTVSLV